MWIMLDTYYRDTHANVAALGVKDLHASTPDIRWSCQCPLGHDYEPGAFYKRELPGILTTLAYNPGPAMTGVVIDAYVDLDEHGHGGLGRYLYDALDRKVPIIGVAKSKFRDAPAHWELRRGQSDTPLFVTSAGMSLADAKALVKDMHGPYRMPTLLTLVDQYSRQ